MNIYLGENIKKLRRKRDLTQEKLADLIGVSFQAISKWERGESFPDVAMLPIIADFFGCSIDDLFGVDKAKNEQKIGEYLELYSKECSKNRALTFKKFRQAVKEFPNDFRILVRYMELLLEEKDEPFIPNPDYVKTGSSEAEKSNNPYKHGLMKNPCYEKISQELLSIYDNIQNRCTDDSIRIWSKHVIIKHLIKKYHLSFDEKKEKWRCDDEPLKKAKEILSSMPFMRDSREYLSASFDSSMWDETHLNAIEEMLYLLQNMIIEYRYYPYDNGFSPEYKINLIKHMNELFSLVDNESHISKNRIHLIYNYGHLGHLYCRIGDYQNAIKYLKLCSEYARELDEHPEIEERISRFYETENMFRKMTMCERMKLLMTEHYHLPDDFKATAEFQEILKIME